MAWLEAIVERADKLGPVGLLAINALLFLLVLVSHVGFVILYNAGKPMPPGVDDFLVLTKFTIPIAAAGLLLSLSGLGLVRWRGSVLQLQAAFLLLGAIFALGMGVETILNGIPPGTRFAWNPVFFAFVLAYPVYLARRVWFGHSIQRLAFCRYAHVGAIVISIVVSVLVFVRASVSTA